MGEPSKKESAHRDSVRMFRLGGITIAYVAVYVLLICAIVILCQKSHLFFYQVFGPASLGEQREITFQVDETDTMKNVSERLERQGLIAGQNSFQLYIKLMNIGKRQLKPGEYQLHSGMDYEEIINRLTVSQETGS